MKICASLGGISDVENIEDADLVEIRTDIFDDIPNIVGKDALVTFRDAVDLSILPPGYSGMIDVGQAPVPKTNLRVIASYHDYESTPDSEHILSLLKNEAYIAKGAFLPKNFEDLHNIYLASCRADRKHILVGMGELGMVTRIRSQLLKNEFTFGYVGQPTATGQLSVDAMKKLGDDCIITGIIGSPLSKTLSPRMHNAAFESENINGTYLKFESPDLDHAEDVIREYNIKGVNVTIPYKNDMISHVDSISEESEEIGAINTVVNDNGILKGYNTDVVGIEKALNASGFDCKGRRVLIMGSGGAARACAYILGKMGCRVTVTGRNRSACETLSKKFGCEYRPQESVPVAMYDLIVNCTPIGMYGDGEYPVNIVSVNRHQTILDMVYGETTPLIKKAESVGANIASGKDMLIFQGAESFRLWTGKEPISAMRDAIS